MAKKQLRVRPCLSELVVLVVHLQAPQPMTPAANKVNDKLTTIVMSYKLVITALPPASITTTTVRVMQLTFSVRISNSFC